MTVRSSSASPRTINEAPSTFERDGARRQMVPRHEDPAFAGQQTHVELRADGGALLSRTTGLQDLIDGVPQPLDVGEHDVVELLALWVGHRPGLEGVEYDGSTPAAFSVRA